MSTEDHQDLMDLASRHAYKSHGDLKPGALVAGGKYRVAGYTHDLSNGLDAYTFQNVKTGEYTITFVGSVEDMDWFQNAQLIPPLTPSQYTAAEEYYKDVVDRIGPVSNVCGNSLGGGLAAYVALHHPDVEAVTVNPAPVPEKYAGAKAPNVHNYILTNDILHHLVMAGGMESRIVGDVTKVNSTPLTFSSITENHIGSAREDGAYDASMTVPFSLFHKNTTIGANGFGDRIHVTAVGLTSIADALEQQLADLESVMADGFNRVATDLTEELTDRPRRAAIFRNTLADSLHELISPLTKELRGHEEEIRSWVHDFKRLLPPGPLQWVWDECYGTVDSAITKALTALDEIVAISAHTIAYAVWLGQEAQFFDAGEQIISELLSQQEQLTGGFGLATDRWSAVGQHTRAVQTALAATDAAIAAAVADGTCPRGVLPVTGPPWPPGTVTPLHSSASKKIAEWIISRREESAGAILGGVINMLLQTQIIPLRALLDVAAAQFEIADVALGVAADAARAVVAGAAANPFAYLTGTSDDLWHFQEQIRHFKNAFQSSCERWSSGLMKFSNTLGHLPAVIMGLAPDLANGIFSDTTVEEVYNSYIKCRNLTERSAVSFAEVAYQYGDHTALAIDALAERATEVKQDLTTLTTSLYELTG